jgi:hypothetical protein
MTYSSTKNHRFFGIWRKRSTAPESAIGMTSAENRPNQPYHQNNDTLPPRLQRDIGLMGGMFSSAMGRRS